jgi:hypothetical protein
MPRYDAASAFQLVYIASRQESSPQLQYDKKSNSEHRRDLRRGLRHFSLNALNTSDSSGFPTRQGFLLS